MINFCFVLDVFDSTNSYLNLVSLINCNVNQKSAEINKSKFIPNCFLKNVKILEVSNYDIFKDSFLKYKNIKSLKVSNSNIMNVNIPQSIVNLELVICRSINSCDIQTTFLTEINNTELKFFKMNYSNGNSIKFSNCNNLSHIDLSLNFLRKIEISNCKKLLKLDLRGNYLFKNSVDVKKCGDRYTYCDLNPVCDLVTFKPKV